MSSARVLLWVRPRASVASLVKRLARAGAEVIDVAHDVAAVREILSTTAPDIIVAAAAAVNACLTKGSRAARGVAFDVPLLLIGVPDAPAGRRLLLNPAVDFASERPRARELSLRMERLLIAARSRLATPDRPIAVPVQGHPLRLGKRAPALTPTEFALLSALARSSGAVVSPAQLAAVLREHGSRCAPGSNLLPVYISYLRRKLAVFDRRVVIRTHHARGYSLECADGRTLPPALKRRRTAPRLHVV